MLDATLAEDAAQFFPDADEPHEATPASNLSITLWQVEALRLAAALGWDRARPQADRGLRWIASVADDEGQFGYRQTRDFPAGSQTLTAMGAMSLLDAVQPHLLSQSRRQAIRTRVGQLAAVTSPDMDYYCRYFLTAALRKMGEESSIRHLSSMRRDLVAQQVTEGPQSGSWNANDRWSGAGGRVYATAMACLSLL